MAEVLFECHEAYVLLTPRYPIDPLSESNAFHLDRASLSEFRYA
jgi:hypothetical protein